MDAKILPIFKNMCVISKIGNMSKKIIGFDIGSYTIKTSVWNESTNEAIPSDASLVKNDTFGYMSK